jgi:DNA-binding SARP family transcriptional activator
VADVCLTLLGPPTVSHAGVGPLVPQPSAKALALLTFLALEPGPHTRDELAGLLWGESSDAEARTSLRQALKQLRSQLGELLDVNRTTVALQDTLQCDIRDFRLRISSEPALALSTEIPRFLCGFSIRHAPRFEEWAADTRRGLMLVYQDALSALAREAMGQWRWRDAISISERWLAGDPLSDEASRLGIEARFLAGDRGAALGRYQEYRATLLQETGCQPSRALLNLMRRVEADAQSVNIRPISDEWYARAPRFQSSLIGREKEWGTLARSWAEVERGRSRVLLLEGEVGVGKSRLADEFLRWTVANGGSVLRGHGYDASPGIPYEPIVEILRDALGTPGLAGTPPEWLAEVARLLPEIRQRFDSLPESTHPIDSSSAWRLFEAVAQVILALAAEHPIVLWIDDLQWCDGDSCELLRYLSRRTEAAPVLWLGTLSLGEVERDAPSARLCRVLRAKPQATVIPLRPLGEEELWRMIHEMGHVSTPTGARRFANRMYGVTAGNPFYVIELLKTMFAQGLLTLDEESGEWTVSPGALSEHSREFPVSQTVRDVIAERIERLPDELRETLMTVAVAGSGCRPEVLSHVHSISRLHAAAAADALVDRRLLIEEGGAYRCAHPVIAHVVRDGLSDSRRREVHRSLALALERLASSAEGGGLAREIARHADRGGEAALAYRFARLASKSAVERYAFAEAVSWLDLAATNAMTPEEAGAVNQLTAEVLEAAGWTEAPAPERQGGPVTRGLDRDDLDLRMSPGLTLQAPPK